MKIKTLIGQLINGVQIEQLKFNYEDMHSVIHVAHLLSLNLAPCVSSLHFHTSHLTDFVVNQELGQALIDMFQKNTSLSQITLEHLVFSQNDLIELFNAISANSKITRLRISEVPVRKNCLNRLANVIEKLPNLNELRIRNFHFDIENSFWQLDGRQELQNVFNAIANSSSLKSLQIIFPTPLFSKPFCETLYNANTNLFNLEILNLHENDLNEQHIECLAKCLTKQTCIKELNLASINTKTKKIKKRIFNSLSPVNRISDDCLTILCKHANALRVLDLTDNAVQSGALVAEYLKSHSNLTCLKLFNVEINDYQPIINALDVNKTILAIDIAWRSAARDQIVAKLQRNQRIQWRVVHPLLLNVCIAFATFNLPPYVLLEIFDRLPLMTLVQQKKKIDLIIAVRKSILKVYENRIKQHS